MKYLYSNLFGCFVFDNQFNLVESVPFKESKDFLKKEKAEANFKKKYRDAIPVPEEKLEIVLSYFKKPSFFPPFYNLNWELTKKEIKESVSEDVLIIQAISAIEELNKSCNLLSKRMREWYSWYCPELVRQVEDNEKLAELIVTKNRAELLKETKSAESIGADLKKEDVEEILELGREIVRLFSLKKKKENYLKKIMSGYCPNLLELAGVTIGAQLMELGKGLKHLAVLPASTVQLLGAEKALFRHIKTGAKSPKYGVIINHPLIQKAGKKDKGKAARSLADKLSFCARLDYFKGEFKAKEYQKELEAKFNPGKQL